jgi:hypothetical protein
MSRLLGEWNVAGAFLAGAAAALLGDAVCVIAAGVLMYVAVVALERAS